MDALADDTRPFGRNPAARDHVAGETRGVDRLPVRIRSQRLTLRRWGEHDVAALTAAVSTSLDHLRPWMPWASAEPLSAAERLALIRRWQADGEGGGDVVFGVFRGDVVIGGAGLHRRIGPGGLEIGYWIHVDHTRQGYACEAAAVLTTAALTVRGVERVEIHHDKANVASAGVPRKLGFTYSHESRDAVAAPGEIGVDCCWSMSRPAWRRGVRAGADGDHARW